MRAKVWSGAQVKLSEDLTGLGYIRIKRAARVTVNASPEPVTKGRPITVTGKITRADFGLNRYVNYGSKQATLQFRKAGTNTYTAIRTVTANSAGDLRTTVTAPSDGYWRWSVGGTTTTAGAGSLAAAAPIFGRLTSGDEVYAIFYLTPRGRLVLTPLSVEQTDALAAHLAGLGHSPANVIADHDTASAFAQSWQRHTSAAPEPFWRTHLYRLGTLTPPQPRPEGQGRITGGQDREQVVRWCREFCVDVGEQRSIDLIDAGSWDDSRFGDRHFTFWETPDGIPVSMAAATSIVGGMVRVDPVYTPAHLRGRGYAVAVTVEASRAALAAGATDVVLFTDPDNPTSNALYQRIGYVHVADFAGYKFS